MVRLCRQHCTCIHCAESRWAERRIFRLVVSQILQAGRCWRSALTKASCCHCSSRAVRCVDSAACTAKHDCYVRHVALLGAKLGFGLCCTHSSQGRVCTLLKNLPHEICLNHCHRLHASAVQPLLASIYLATLPSFPSQLAEPCIINTWQDDNLQIGVGRSQAHLADCKVQFTCEYPTSTALLSKAS